MVSCIIKGLTVSVCAPFLPINMYSLALHRTALQATPKPGLDGESETPLLLRLRHGSSSFPQAPPPLPASPSPRAGLVGPCSGGGRRHGGERAAVVGGLLRRVLPRRPPHRQVRRGDGGAARPPLGGLPPPAPLPRLLRAGLRRVGAAGRHGGLHRREGSGAERGVAARLRRHRQHQDAAGVDVPADRLLRRHPRRRRPRLRRTAGRPILDGSPGQAGRDHGECVPGQQRPPWPHRQPQRPPQRFRQQGAQHHRHGRPLRSPHRRPGAVQELPGPDLQRHRHRRRLRGVAAGQLPGAGGGRRRRRAGAARRVVAGRLRQRLLREPALPAGAAALRPGALRRRRDGRPGPGVRVRRRPVGERLRGRDGQDGQHQPAHRHGRRDQGQLPESKQLIKQLAIALIAARGVEQCVNLKWSIRSYVYHYYFY